MSDSSDPAEAGQALVPADPAEPALDAHGHDPAAYEWVPVLRKPRKDGWTPQRQRDFIAALADSACVAEAARAAGMTTRSCYRLRRESPQFAAAWEAALAHGARHLVDLAFDRAIHGSDEPVFDSEGHRVGRRLRQNDRLLMFLLRAYLPERFRHAHRSVRMPGEPEPPGLPPVEEAMRLLEPAAPPDPHRLMPPDALADALLVADLGDGRLPGWHRGRGDAECEPRPVDLTFERMLENAKREGAGLPPVEEGWLPPGYREEGPGDAFLA
ncbi:MAG: hypothetical protein AB7O91_07760 [Sphingomonas sp.]